MKVIEAKFEDATVRFSVYDHASVDAITEIAQEDLREECGVDPLLSEVEWTIVDRYEGAYRGD